ncbi:response regulator [Paenibacillus sp. KQZ6P-2]|uniref:Response regulator n=1 Tax=Paenibacillus mangrovi TaxID=2931978 RepID=A0A9X1WMP0_9BACL|nr:response regulator [Paenibacillus mangrovi]MCJ8012097.1 response regulator [Paenibacillus mangrovi]
MNIIVADDEMLARETLIGILEDNGPGLEIREAGSGQELIDLVRQWKPDVAFVDIRMPGKSGLEAIKEALPFAPSTQWIMLTGYAEFEYAREAIQLGAVDYLLKPVDPQRVENILKQAKAKAGQESLSYCRDFEAQMVSVFHDQILPEPSSPSPASAGESWLAVLIYEDKPMQTETSGSTETLVPVTRILRETINGCCSKELLLALVTLSKDEHLLIGKASTEKDRRSLLRLPEEITEHSRQLTTFTRMLTSLQTKEHTSLSPLRDEVAKLRALSYLRSVTEVLAPLGLSEMESLGANPVYAKTGRIAADLAKAYQRGDYVAFISSCEKLQTHWMSQPVMLTMLKERLVSYFRCVIGPHLTYDVQLDTDWLGQLPEAAGASMLKKKSVEEKQDWLDAVIRYLEANFCGDITVAGVAERFQVSPNHLSTLFHKKMGVTFIQYMTRLRMLKAQELLSIPGMKVVEAAEQVGYYSTRHFTNLFKENVGCYPSEFSKKHQR